MMFYQPPLPNLPTVGSLQTNSAQLLDESGRTKYNCQRCANHGVYNQVWRNHKSECPHINCTCKACQFVNERRDINRQFEAIRSELSSFADSPESIQTEDLPSFEPPASVQVDVETLEDLEDDEEEEDLDEGASETGEGLKKSGRKPCCQRCQGHRKRELLKGHKRRCPYQKCECNSCILVERRRELMAKQIKFRRDQKKKKDEQERDEQRRKETELFSRQILMHQQVLAQQQQYSSQQQFSILPQAQLCHHHSTPVYAPPQVQFPRPCLACIRGPLSGLVTPSAPILMQSFIPVQISASAMIPPPIFPHYHQHTPH